MVLGTVQLGVPYGIANRSGIPTKEESFKILQAAWNAGIRYFDTAPSYKSESIIGDFVRSQGLQKEIHIFTKIPNLNKGSNWKDLIYRSLTDSFSTLGCTLLDVLFIHNPQDSILLIKEPDFFNKILTMFPIKSLGVSVYDPIEIELVNGSSFNLAFQFPFNLLDRRFEKNTIPIGKRYARSIFLQGILAAQTLQDRVPDELKKFHSNIKNDCNLSKISLKQLSFSFIIHSNCYDFFLVGVDSAQQLTELIAMDLVLNINFNVITEKWRAMISDKLLDPRKWS
jgi:aryl-alcohol dehydrogenase-like predicted oxidoreductase